jgi:hypothetical protein
MRRSTRWLLLALFLATVPAAAQMKSGFEMTNFREVMGLTKEREATGYTVTFIRSSAPASVLWTGEQADFTFQVVNKGDAAIAATGKIDLIAYGTKGQPGDIWVPIVEKHADLPSLPLAVTIAKGGYATYTVKPTLPLRNGAYALVLDLGPLGRRFITSCVRTFKPNPKPVQFPQLCLDNGEIALLTRLGAAPNRMGFGYKCTTDPDFPQWYAKMGEQLTALKEAGLPITVEFGGGAFYHACQPLGRPRPWLDGNDTMMDTKFDLAWLPSYDADFKKVVKMFAVDYGWPKGPVNGFKLWNEPWNGISISGWGADDERYREIFTVMCEAVEEARAEAGCQALLGGCDSSSNTFDKLFSDGSDKFLKWLDFCSIHYQGMHPPSTVKAWVDRKSPYGRVKIWDTESWVANTDDRVAAVVATNLSTGHDRAVGVYGGNIADAREMYWQGVDIFGPDGKKTHIQTGHTWSVAASVGAVTHFIGERKFRELLFKNGLPWVMLFDGLPDDHGTPNPEDGTVVVVGDIGEEFGADTMLFRTARGFAERRHKAALQQQLAALPADATPEARRKLETAIATPETLSDATMTLKAKGNAFSLYDFYGNPVPAKRGKIVIPLDGRGFFLRPSGKSGSAAALRAALLAAEIRGIEPVAPQVLDFTAPIASRPALRVRLTNVLNREITGTLKVTVDGLTLEVPTEKLHLSPNVTYIAKIPVTGGAARDDNAYPCTVVFDAGKDGAIRHTETVHANTIPKRAIAVDGKLDDWQGVPPQTVSSDGVPKATLMEYAWQPFKTFDDTVKKGFATGYLAYDANYLYFAAKVADTTVDPGMPRYATLEDDEFFYPATSYSKVDPKGTAISVRWSGTVTPKFSETYTFITINDDGARLWVDGKPLVNDWTSHAAHSNSGTIALEAGKAYKVVMEYYDGGGGGTARLQWVSPSQKHETIPASALKALDGTPGLTGHYYRGTTFNGPGAVRVDAGIDLQPTPQNTPAALWTAPETKTDAYAWPEGVRRYSYRKDPDLPAGNFPNHDNVQLAFNVLPSAQKPWYANPPGTMPGYIGYRDTDYEYALNPVAAKYGGGVEIWRLQYPGMPHKHFYPRDPASPFDGPVKDGKLVIVRDATTRYVECALPWAEIPDVKKCLDAGYDIKFSFRVNDDAGAGCMELSKGRSVAKRNGSFTVDWTEHWANELEFGFEE